VQAFVVDAFATWGLVAYPAMGLFVYHDQDVPFWTLLVCVVAPFVGLVAAEAAGGTTPGAGFQNLAVWAPGRNRLAWWQILLRAIGKILDLVTLGLVARFADLFSGTRLIRRSEEASGLDRPAGGRAVEAYVAFALVPDFLAASALTSYNAATGGGPAGALIGSAFFATLAWFTWALFIAMGRAAIRRCWLSWRSRWWPTATALACFALGLLVGAEPAARYVQTSLAFEAVRDQQEILLRPDNFLEWVAGFHTRGLPACVGVEPYTSGGQRARGPGVIWILKDPPYGWELAHEHFSLPPPLRAKNAEEAQWVAYYQERYIDETLGIGLLVVTRSGTVIAREGTCVHQPQNPDVGQRSDRLMSRLRPHLEAQP
jgi:hypothetical protein